MNRSGVRAFTCLLVYRLARRYLGIHLYRINVRHIRLLREPYEMPVGIECRVLTSAELRGLVAEPDLQLGTEFVERALHRGNYCIGAFKGNTLAAYAWRSFDIASHTLGVIVRVTPPVCYSYKAFTRERFRGKKIWPALSRTSDEICLKQGRDQMIGFIEVDNFASIKAAQTLGAIDLGFAGFFRLFGRCLPFHDRRIKRTGFRFEYQPLHRE